MINYDNVTKTFLIFKVQRACQELRHESRKRAGTTDDKKPPEVSTYYVSKIQHRASQLSALELRGTAPRPETLAQHHCNCNNESKQ